MDSRIARIARVVLWISSMVVTYFVGVQVGSQAKPTPVAVAPEVKTGSSRVGSALGTRSETNDGSAANSAPVASVAGEARDVRALISQARRDLAQPGAMFSASSLLRIMEPMTKLTAEELQGALREVDGSSDNPQENMVLKSLILGRWAELDPKGAMAEVDRGLSTEEGQSQMGLYFGVVSQWANRDPEAAWNWYEKKRDAGQTSGQGFGLASAIFSSMAGKNLDLALTRLAGLEDADERNMAASGIAMQATKPESWKRILDGLSGLNDEDRKLLRSNMMSQWAMQNFDAMTDLIRELPAAEANEAVDSVGYSLMWSKPEKGAAFLVETATPEALPARYAMIVSAWANRNPNDAGAWLNRQPPGPAQDAARATFARTVVRKDPESAFAWARSVTESEQRTNALRDVIQVWSARDAKAANQALAASGLGAKEIQAIQGGRQN